MVIRRLLAVSLVALSACSDGDGAASTDSTPPSSAHTGAARHVADLTVRIEHPDADPIEYRIVCFEDDATVQGVDSIDGPTACARLEMGEVRDRLWEFFPVDRVCTLVYGGPDTATISGSVGDRGVQTTIDRVDGCGISDWDDLLSGVLPPPRGAGRPA